MFENFSFSPPSTVRGGTGGGGGGGGCRSRSLSPPLSPHDTRYTLDTSLRLLSLTAPPTPSATATQHHPSLGGKGTLEIRFQRQMLSKLQTAGYVASLVEGMVISGEGCSVSTPPPTGGGGGGVGERRKSVPMPAGGGMKRGCVEKKKKRKGKKGRRREGRLASV